MTHTAKLCSALIVACAVIAAGWAGAAPATGPSGNVLRGPSSAPGSAFTMGATCRRTTDTAPGEVKMDACKRVYCGRKDVKDIIEIVPNFAQINHCTWTLVANHCKCRR